MAASRSLSSNDVQPARMAVARRSVPVTNAAATRAALPPPNMALRLQPKLTVSDPNDIYEQEADRIADQILRMPDPSAARSSVDSAPIRPLSIQRQCRACEEEGLQRRAAVGPGAATEHDGLDTVAATLRQGGRPLDTATRAFFEPRFGHDFGSVRVHTDARAAESARGVQALAYTVGHNIVFDTGQYTPHRDSGKRLLAHELTHVVQQTGGDGNRVGPSDETRGQPPIGLGNQVGAAGFHARLATASGTVLDDEPFMVALAPASQRVARQFVEPTMRTSNVPVLQRVANFVAGTVNATTNIAAHIIAGNRDMGFTPPTLNGTATLSVAGAQGALNPPVLGGRSNADGTVSTWVNTVPTNEASFTMQLPSGGPWSTVAAKADVATLFASLGLATQAGCSTAGNSTFSVNGRPSDAGFAANVRTHEDLHAADHRTGFNSVIVPWDARLQAAKTAGTVFNGATQADAEAALFTAMGGTPNQIAAAQFREWIRLNNLTHTGATLATGGPATPSNSAANATCTTSSLDVT